MTKGWGGKRSGAGRPRGSGQHSETTKVMRIPVSKINDVKTFLDAKASAVYKLGENIAALSAAACVKTVSIPLFSTSVQAGFPAPVDDHIANKLDLNQYLIESPETTFFVRVSGDSMINVGIYEGDILVVDRGIQARNGKIIVAVVNGEMTVKRLFQTQERVILYPENMAYPALEITEDMDFRIWGVVRNSIHYLD